MFRHDLLLSFELKDLRNVVQLKMSVSRKFTWTFHISILTANMLSVEEKKIPREYHWNTIGKLMCPTGIVAILPWDFAFYIQNTKSIFPCQMKILIRFFNKCNLLTSSFYGNDLMKTIEFYSRLIDFIQNFNEMVWSFIQNSVEDMVCFIVKSKEECSCSNASAWN